MSIDHERIKSIIESLIFVSESPLPFAKIRAILESVPADELKEILAEMAADYQKPERGFQLEEVAMGYQFRTRPENVEWVRMLVEKKPQKLSRASLETLAMVAYSQPVTKPEIEAIRGVDSGSAINLLLEKRLIRILGRKDAPGKPFIFGTTREFLELFNLKDLSGLPTLKEISNLETDDAERFANPGGAVLESETDGAPLSPAPVADGPAEGEPAPDQIPYADDPSEDRPPEEDLSETPPAPWDEDDAGEKDSEAADEDEFED